MASVCSSLPLSSALPLPVDFKLSVQGNQTTEPVRNVHVTENSLMTGLSCVRWRRGCGGNVRSGLASQLHLQCSCLSVEKARRLSAAMSLRFTRMCIRSYLQADALKAVNPPFALFLYVCALFSLPLLPHSRSHKPVLSAFVTCCAATDS